MYLPSHGEKEAPSLDGSSSGLPPSSGLRGRV